MKKLRILMIASEFPPRAAGIGNAAFNIAQTLNNIGHSVTCITRGSFVKSKTRKYHNILIHELPFIAFFPPIHMFYHAIFVNKFITKHEQEFDLIHIHSPLVPHIKSSLPIITTVHSTWAAEAESFKKIMDWYSLAVHIFKKSFINNEKRLFNNSLALIAISESIAGELVKTYKIERNKITVIRNSINLPTKIIIRSQKQNINILTISRLVQRKGILDFIEAARISSISNPDLHFTIIGKGPMKNSIVEKIRKYKMESSIELMGEVPHSAIGNYLSSAALFVIPSYYEGLPLTLLEALAHGKPVVATNIDGISEVIKNGENGILVNKESPKELAKAMLRVLSSISLQTKLQKGALMSIKQFDPARAASQTIKLYRTLRRN